MTQTPDELRKVLQEAERKHGQRGRHHRLIREEFCRVTANLWPALIPRAAIHAPTLLQSVMSEFGASFNPQSYLRGIPGEARQGLTHESVLSHALSDDDAVIVFDGGHLTISDSARVTPINQLQFSEQVISATVVGTSEEAEYCLRKLAILISQAAGVNRVWKDFEPHVELWGYTTSTVVDLGMSITDMLAPEFREFLETYVAGADAFGQQMGGVSRGIDRSTLRVTPAATRIELSIGVWDELSGKANNCNLEILAHTRGDYNRHRVKFLTELPSTQHLELVEQLVTSFSPPD